MLKVLIVEDETGIRTIIKKYLSKFDITCIEAENGKKGYEKALSVIPDIIIKMV